MKVLLLLLASWLSAVAQAQLYQYGIVNPPQSVVDVFDVPQTRGSSHCYDNQGRTLLLLRNWVLYCVFVCLVARARSLRTCYFM